MGDRVHGRARVFQWLPTGIRSKLVWASLLMSVVPIMMLLLVAAWFAFPHVRDFYELERWFPLIGEPTVGTWWLTGLIGLTAFISVLGSMYLTAKLVHPLIQISQEAKCLAEGDVSRELPVQEGDELGDLTASLNRLTSRIRDNMSELKEFGERTNQINTEIHQRVIMLSGLLQVGELMSRGSELDLVVDVVVEILGLFI